MKITTKAAFTRFLIIFLLTSLSAMSATALSSAATPKIGDSYGGGVVVYIDSTGQHGLIAAKTDMPGHSYQKEEGFFNWYGAKDAATAFVEGFSDWVLPNREQLNKLYINRSAVAGMASTVYWSSSEGDAENAWAENFASGEQLVGKKTNGSHVRAVRLF
ncbi:MAG: DUF1566 domain-containing protein [Chlorobium sp.]|nr:MAG: DUF1566 domain-containing protein [Chlorobium sp.]